MTVTPEKSALNRSVVIATAFLAAALLVGVVLFVVFAGDVRPLLEPGLNLTTITTT
jgi:hypothetical protein